MHSPIQEWHRGNNSLTGSNLPQGVPRSQALAQTRCPVGQSPPCLRPGLQSHPCGHSSLTHRVRPVPTAHSPGSPPPTARCPLGLLHRLASPTFRASSLRHLGVNLPKEAGVISVPAPGCQPRSPPTGASISQPRSVWLKILASLTHSCSEDTFGGFYFFLGHNCHIPPTSASSCITSAHMFGRVTSTDRPLGLSGSTPNPRFL